MRIHSILGTEYFKPLHASPPMWHARHIWECAHGDSFKHEGGTYTVSMLRTDYQPD